jgi:hypothetical protein
VDLQIAREESDPAIAILRCLDPRVRPRRHARLPDRVLRRPRIAVAR